MRDVGEPGQVLYIDAADGPFVHEPSTEALVKIDRRSVPTEDRPFQPSAAAVSGELCHASKQGVSDAPAPVFAAALVNPAVRARSVVELIKDAIGRPYLWNEQSHAAADRLDFVACAGDIAARTPQPPLLVISGELDFPVLRTDAAELVDALRERYAQPDHVRRTTVAELPHSLAEQPGLEPAPQLSATKMVDEAMTRWFLRHLTAR